MLPRQFDTLDRRRRTVDALRHREHRRLARRRVDDPVDGLTLRTGNDEVRHVLDEEVHRRIGVALVVPFAGKVEVISQERLQTRVTAGRRQRTDALADADVQNRSQGIERRTGQRPRSVEAQVEGIRHLQLQVEARQKIGVAVLRRDRLGRRVGHVEQRRVRGASFECDRHTTDAARRQVRDFLTYTRVEVEGHPRDFILEIDADIGGPCLFPDVLDAGGIKRQIEGAGEVRADRAIGIVEAGDILGLRITETFQIFLIGPRIVDQQLWRQIARESWDPVVHANRTAIKAGRNGHARVPSGRRAIAGIGLPEIVGEGVAVLQLEAIFHIATAELDAKIAFFPGTAQAELLDFIRVLLDRAHCDVRSDDRRIAPALLIPGGTIGGQFGEAVLAVADDANAQVGAEQTTITDVAILATDAVAGILLALGVGRISLELQVFGGIPLQVDAHLVGFE